MTTDKFHLDSQTGHREGQHIIHLHGPFTMPGTFDFRTTARAITVSTLILDFSGVPYMDSAGLGSLVSAYISSQKSGRRVVLAGVNEKVGALLEMTHISNLFPKYPTVSLAEEALA